MIAELDAFEVSSTSTGLLSYNAPTGLHDDIVCSLMLSHLALIQYGDKDMSVSVMEAPRPAALKEGDKPPEDKRSAVEQFYNALAGDDDDD
jgi:hypothetical protein